MLIRLKFSLDQLVNTMLDQLPEEVVINGTFLDPAIGGGQFVKEVERRKRLAGKSAEEIALSVFGFEENILRRDFAVNKYKLEGTYKVGNIFELEEDMKFGVVVGNPPYQDPNNDKRMLWNQIIDKAVEVTADGGYIAMVNPTTWLTAKTNIHNSYKMFETKQVERAVIYDKNDKPFDEGTSVSYTITKNVKRAYPTPLFYGQYSTGTETHVADINIAKDKIWPGQLTPMHLAIHSRLQTHQKIKFLKSCEFHNQKLKKKKMVADTRDNVFQYTHHVSAAITRYTNTKFSNHATWKVMVPLTSTIDRAVVDNNCGHGEDMLSLYVADQQTADNIKALFNTQLYKFIGKLYKSGRNQPLQNLFPILDFTKTWTDDELNDHFGFTDEEREYIANFK